MVKRADPMRPSTQPPPDSWWTDPAVQHDRAAFAAKLTEQVPRQTAVTVSYTKPPNGGRDV